MRLYWGVLAVAVLLSSPVQAGSFREALKDIGKSAQQNLEKGSGGGVTAAQASSGAAQEATWRDPKTGLTWRLCALGSKWRDNPSERSTQCTDGDGRPFDYKWWEAVLAVKQLNINGYTDWRLPTLREVAQLHENCDFMTTDKEFYEWKKYKTSKGDIDVLESCLRGTDQSPYLNSRGPVMYRQMDGRGLWTSSLSENKKEVWQYFTKSLPVDGNNLAAVLIVRGGSRLDFDDLIKPAIAARDRYEKSVENEEVARKAALEEQTKKEEAYRQAEFARNRATLAALEKREKALAQRRKNLKVGEKVTVSLPGDFKPYPGLVLEIKSDLVRVQIMNPIQEIWVKRDQIYF